MSILFTFPGQGAQKAGMLHALPMHPETARTLEEAGQALGQDPLALDSAAALRSTVAVQLCLLVAGVAMARVLAAHDAAPDMVAGLSVGAYPAAVTAGVLDYADALRLVALRASLMERDYPEGYGMVAICGLDRYQLEAVLARVHAPSAPVYLANLNGPQQMVIAGADAALETVAQLALAGGALRAERLSMSVPSHCPLLNGAAAEMAQALTPIPLRRSQMTYLSSSAARALSDPVVIGADLASNMARQVHWFATARLAWERGARLALEMPSGSVLTRLTAPVFEQGRAEASDGSRIDTLRALVRRARGES